MPCNEKDNIINKSDILNEIKYWSLLQLDTKKYNNDLSIEEMIGVLNNTISDENLKKDIFNYYIIYILKKTKLVQNKKIKWYRINDEELKDRPIVEFDDNGNWKNELLQNKRKVLIMK